MHYEKSVTKLDRNVLRATLRNCNPPFQNGKFQCKVIRILRRTMVQSFSTDQKHPHPCNLILSVWSQMP